LRQSGQFVGLRRADDVLAGNLRFESERLTGDVECLDGASAAFDARVADERITGTLAGESLAAGFSMAPPAPGAQRPRPPRSLAGEYRLVPESVCLGGRIELEGSGRTVHVLARERERGELTYGAMGQIAGRVECLGGGAASVAGSAMSREATLTLVGESEAGAGPLRERVTAQKQREFGATLAAFFLAVAAVVLCARLGGVLAVRLSQPRVMGEVAAGIVLGPTVFGALLPEVQRALFPADIIPYIGVAANLGLIFYMFLVGLELDLGQLKGRVAQTAIVSNTGVAIPMLCGLLVAVPVYSLLAPDAEFVAFALFMGVAMSITAFPVLARILTERRMLTRPLGALALASAAVDDVTAWFLIALATAVAATGPPLEVAWTILLAGVFCVFMASPVRRGLRRMSVAYDEAGRVPTAWITVILAGVLLSAFATEEIGIALIFGAFIMGAVMPRHAGLTEDVTHRLEDFVVLLLLPLFFCFTGLRTNVLLLNNVELLLVTAVLVAVAIACKFGGTILAARVTGLPWRDSAVLGALMNTRGLTELIVLNLALEKGIISEALFAALVLMALVTTFMAGPVINRLDPDNSFGEPLDDELERARRETEELSPLEIPERAILVASESEVGLRQLVALAEPLASSPPVRELLLVRLEVPPLSLAVRGGLQTESRLLAEAAASARAARSELLQRGVAARAVAITAPSSGDELGTLAAREQVDLLLVDGRRPLLGGGVPRGAVGAALESAPSDVAVLVARDDAPPRHGAPILVPFGGADHDWAAVELGAWLASTTGAPLHILGAAAGAEAPDSARRLASVSLLVQQFVGVVPQPVLVESGRAGVLEAAAEAGLLVIGLSDRWRREGLGATRSAIARDAAAPILFVRRGTRAGALAPATDLTAFRWSSGTGAVREPERL
jgi:Kef-type K+ transport system membrane component KefB